MQKHLFLVLYDYFGELIANEIIKMIHPTVKLYAYNCCFGMFSLSEKGYGLYCEKKGIEYKKSRYGYHFYHGRRDDSALIEVVQELGKEANGKNANIELEKVFEEYEIDLEEYDGTEYTMMKYNERFYQYCGEILSDSLTDIQKILLIRQKKREIEWAQKVEEDINNKIIKNI